MAERPPVQSVSLNLPRPISVNALWRAVMKGKHPTIIKSAQYRTWLEEAGYMLNAQRPGCVLGPYALTIKLAAGSKLDLGNVEKSVSDLLQSHKVIENDRLAQKIMIERANIEDMYIMVASTREIMQ